MSCCLRELKLLRSLDDDSNLFYWRTEASHQTNALFFNLWSHIIHVLVTDQNLISYLITIKVEEESHETILGTCLPRSETMFPVFGIGTEASHQMNAFILHTLFSGFSHVHVHDQNHVSYLNVISVLEESHEKMRAYHVYHLR